MSWNKYCIVVTNVLECDLDKVVKSIGYHIMTPSTDIDFRTAFGNRGDEMPFGLIDNCFWILSSSQVDKFFSPNASSLEKNLIRRFPESVILALEENSTVDSFGFSYIKNSERIRVLNGADREYYYEFGEPIKEEKACYQQLIESLDDEEKQEIIENEGEEGFKQYLLFESRWRVPFTLFTNVYGKSIEDVYNENKMFKNYKYERK